MAAQQPKKPSRNKGGGASKVPGLNESVDTAVKWLKNPEVQEQLLDFAMKFADKVKARAAERPSKSLSNRDASHGDAPQRRQLSLPAVSPQRRLGLLQVWLTSLTPDVLGREGCPHAQEVPCGVQA